MKLNKTLINKVLKRSRNVIVDGGVYEFQADEFRLRVSREQVDALTSAVASKAVNGTIAITNLSGVTEVILPTDLKRYLTFVSNDQARPLLCSVNFTPKSIEATDSYRALVGTNHGSIVGAYDGFALELALLVDGIGYIDYESGALSFGSIVPSDGAIVLNRVDGEYPNVQKLYENDATEQIVISDFPRSIANRNSHISKDVFATFFRDQILVSSFNGNASEQELICEISQLSRIGYDGDDVRGVAFNYKYLKGALDVLPSKGVYEYLYRGVEKPLQLEAGGYRVLLMPTRLRARIVDLQGTELVDVEKTYARESVGV